MTCFLRKGRFCIVLFLGAGGRWQSQQNFCCVLVPRTKSHVLLQMALGLCWTSQPLIGALTAPGSQIADESKNCLLLCMYFILGVCQVMTSLLWKHYAKR